MSKKPTYTDRKIYADPNVIAQSPEETAQIEKPKPPKAVYYRVKRVSSTLAVLFKYENGNETIVDENLPLIIKAKLLQIIEQELRAK
jgi:hypothetical protein